MRSWGIAVGLLLACAGTARAGVFKFFYETDPMQSKQKVVSEEITSEPDDKDKPHELKFGVKTRWSCRVYLQTRDQGDKWSETATMECSYAKTRAKVSADTRCSVVKETGKKATSAPAKLYLGDGSNEIELLLWCE